MAKDHNRTAMDYRRDLKLQTWNYGGIHQGLMSSRCCLINLDSENKTV